MSLLKRKGTPAKIDLTVSSEKETDVDSDEASELAALEQEETEEHGDFINDDPEDSNYEPSNSSTATTEENTSIDRSDLEKLKEQMEFQTTYIKRLESKIETLLEKLEKKQ